MFLAATSYSPSVGKITAPSGDFEAIVGVNETSGALEILVCEYGEAGEDNLPRLHLTTTQFDEIVESLGGQDPGIATLDPDSLITG